MAGRENDWDRAVCAAAVVGVCLAGAVAVVLIGAGFAAGWWWGS